MVVNSYTYHIECVTVYKTLCFILKCWVENVLKAF